MTQEQQDKQAFFYVYADSAEYKRDIFYINGNVETVGPYEIKLGMHDFKGLVLDKFYETAYPNTHHVNDYLELKSLSTISDEIAHEYLHAIGVDCSEERIKGAKIDLMEDYYTDLFSCDFLRSRGFLIEFRQYTTQQLLDMGWAKIKT